MLRGPSQYDEEEMRGLSGESLVHDLRGAVVLELNDDVKTKAELLTEVAVLRGRVAELESRQEDLLQTKLLVEHSSVTLFRFGVKMGYPVDFVSDNVEQFGYTAKELRSGEVSISELIHPDDFQRLVRRARTTFERGQDALREECRIITKNHDVRWTDLRALPVRGPTGKVTHLQGFIVDATEHKRLENQLVQSQKQEIMGRVAGSVAHDFNNVLTAIIGYASLARDALFASDPVRDDIEQVIEISERAANRTHRLLAFARRQLMAPRTVCLTDLLADMDEMLRSLLGESIQFVVTATETLGLIKADPGQLEQILVGLVIGAHDAMPEGGRLAMQTANVTADPVFLSTHEGIAPGEYVMLRMTDTSQGPDRIIDNPVLESLFDAVEPSSGIRDGLGTVCDIVKQNKGYTAVYSIPGRGTVTEIYLPRYEESADAAPSEPEATASVGKETVLLVEDENAVRGPVARSLRDLGYNVLEATDGPAALSVAQTHEGGIDILVTDVVMPHMNGVELARQLGTTRLEMKVLLVSGYADDSLTRYGALDRDTAFLQKPFTVAALARKIRGVLETSRAGQRAAG
jgi:two-component system, cell cycle sensor histidine kinase and response regulator CckA